MMSDRKPAARQHTAANPRALAAGRELAESLLKNQDWEKCVAACKALLKLAPRHHFAQETLATALLQIGDVEQAIAAVARLLEISPRDPLHRLRLATLLQMQGRHGESLFEFERILHMYPDAPFVNDARTAVENLDRMQTQQILLMAAEQDDFRWKLERDPASALAQNNFHLSENGYESLRQMIPGTDEESPERSKTMH